MNQHQPSPFFDKLVFVSICMFFIVAGTISVLKGDNYFYGAALTIAALLIVTSIILLLIQML